LVLGTGGKGQTKGSGHANKDFSTLLWLEAGFKVGIWARAEAFWNFRYPFRWTRIFTGLGPFTIRGTLKPVKEGWRIGDFGTPETLVVYQVRLGLIQLRLRASPASFLTHSFFWLNPFLFKRSFACRSMCPPKSLGQKPFWAFYRKGRL